MKARTPDHDTVIQYEALGCDILVGNLHEPMTLWNRTLNASIDASIINSLCAPQTSTQVH